MLINLSFNPDYAEAQFHSFPNEDFLDISGSAAHLSEFERLIVFRKLKEASKTELSSIENYIAFLAELSNCNFDDSNIRDIKYGELSIYWLLPISVKHDSFHWGQVVFLLLEIVSEWDDMFHFKNENLNILVDKNSEYLQDFIIRNLSLLGINESRINFSYSSNNQRKTQGFFRPFISYLFTILKTQPHKHRYPKVSSNLMFIYGNEPAEDGFMNDYYNLSLNVNSETNVLAFKTSNLLLLGNSRLSSLLRMMKSTLRLIKIKRRLKKVKNTWLKLGGYEIPTDLLKEEFLETLSQLELYIYYDSLLDLFKNYNYHLKVFYQDEFYPQGRIISSAINHSANKNLESYGIQHGLILRTHTVYAINSTEISGNSPLPIPNNFIVWGDYFKDLMLKRIKPEELNIIVAGNLRYINDRSKLTSKPDLSSSVRILWCTTLFYNFKFELNTVKDFINFLTAEMGITVKITIRPHPQNHIKSTQLTNALKLLPKAVITFDNFTNLEDQIINHDVVFSAIYSSVFFDSIALKKDVIRFNSGVALADFTDLDLDLIHDVESVGDFKDEFNKILSRNISDNTNSSFERICHLDRKKWIQIFK